MPYDNELFAAIHKNQADAVKDALAKGANPNAKDDYQDTPLHIAVEHDNSDIISSLLTHGASCDAERSNKDKPIHIAAMRNSINAIALILDKDKNQVGSIGRDGRSPFLYSAGANAIDAMRLLIKNGANVNELPIAFGKAAIHIASINNKPEMIKLLIEHGADIDLLSSSKQTPLKFCITQRPPAIEAAKILLDNGATVDLDDLLPLIRKQRYTEDKKLELETMLKLYSNIDAQATMNMSNQTK